MTKSEGVQVGFSWRTIRTIKLQKNINLYSYNIPTCYIHLSWWQLAWFTSNTNLWNQHQPSLYVFRFTLIPECKYYLLVRKSMIFSHKKVVITQFDANRWFYVPIYAKLLPSTLICIQMLNVEMKQVSVITSWKFSTFSPRLVGKERVVLYL